MFDQLVNVVFCMPLAASTSLSIMPGMPPRALPRCGAWCIAPPSPRLPPWRRGVSSLQCLFKHMQLVVDFGALAAVCRDLAHRVQDRGVVAAAEQLADFRQALL